MINEILIPVTESVKPLGITTLDKNLNFKCQTEELCKKASNKIKALFRIRPYITLKTAKALYHVYILSTFKYKKKNGKNVYPLFVGRIDVETAFTETSYYSANKIKWNNI